MNLPEFIEPAKDLLRKLDRRLLDYKDSHPDACLTFAVYDTDSAREDGDPLYFDADKNASVRELMWETHSYLVSNVCAELRLDDEALIFADDTDLCLVAGGVALFWYKRPAAYYRTYNKELMFWSCIVGQAMIQ